MIKRISKKWLYIFALSALAFCLITGGQQEQDGEETRDGGYAVCGELLGGKVMEELLPFFVYVGSGKEEAGAALLLGRRILGEIPIYRYCMAMKEDNLFIDQMAENELQNRQEQEVQEEQQAESQEIQEQKDWQDSMAEAQEAEEWAKLVQAMEAENQSLQEMQAEQLTQAEQISFMPNEKTNSYDWEILSEYKNLISTFYAIDAGTMIGSDQLNVEKLTEKDFTIDKNEEGPQILIYHTHSLEGFADSVPGDSSQTIVGVGERLTRILTEQYGYHVLHHTEEYDTVRDDAYARSLPALEQLLEDNPSIQVVIDLHRDAGVEGVHRAIDLDGRSTATFMLFNGLSRTKKTGDITYLKNPNLDDNLAFSFQMQVKAGEYYPGLTRKIYLKGYRYNMHLMPRTLLIELGDSNNTVEEAMNTCDPLAHILDMVLSGEG